MGNNDAREQLEVCKDEYNKLEAKYNALVEVADRFIFFYTNGTFLNYAHIHDFLEEFATRFEDVVHADD